MPFGVVYAALFFGTLCVAQLSTSLTGWGLDLWAKLFLSMLAGAIALGLMARRSWARWLGVAYGILLTVLAFFVAGSTGTVTSLLMLFGSVAAVLLLAVPATGNVRNGMEPGQVLAPRAGKLFGSLALVSVIGFAATFGSALRQSPDSPAPAARAASQPPAAERVFWTDFGSGLERAREEGSPMVVTFVAAWCGYCQKMDRTTWKHPEVIQRLGELVAVRVDGEESLERNGFSGSQLAQRYGVRGFPTTLLLDTDGNVISRAGGYQQASQFLSWLEGGLRQPQSNRPRSVRTSF